MCLLCKPHEFRGIKLLLDNPDDNTVETNFTPSIDTNEAATNMKVELKAAIDIEVSEDTEEFEDAIYLLVVREGLCIPKEYSHKLSEPK